MPVSDKPPFDVVQLAHLREMFVEVCKRAKAAGISRIALAGSLHAMAEKLTEDTSPLDRYIDNPGGDNPVAKPV